VCDALGIAWQGQHVKIKADPVLASSIKEIVTEVNRADTGRKTSRTAVVLPIEFANGWLFTKIKADPVLSKGVAEMATPSRCGDQKTTVAEMATMRPDG
jgi:hypothetical protein